MGYDPERSEWSRSFLAQLSWCRCSTMDQPYGWRTRCRWLDWTVSKHRRWCVFCFEDGTVIGRDGKVGRESCVCVFCLFVYLFSCSFCVFVFVVVWMKLYYLKCFLNTSCFGPMVCGQVVSERGNRTSQTTNLPSVHSDYQSRIWHHLRVSSDRPWCQFGINALFTDNSWCFHRVSYGRSSEIWPNVSRSIVGQVSSSTGNANGWFFAYCQRVTCLIPTNHLSVRSVSACYFPWVFEKTMRVHVVIAGISHFPRYISTQTAIVNLPRQPRSFVGGSSFFLVGSD